MEVKLLPFFLIFKFFLFLALLIGGVLTGLLLFALIASCVVWYIRDRRQTAKNSEERSQSFHEPQKFAKGKPSLFWKNERFYCGTTRSLLHAAGAHWVVVGGQSHPKAIQNKNGNIARIFKAFFALSRHFGAFWLRKCPQN